MFGFNKKNQNQGEELELKIKGMHCTSCAMNIDGDLEDLEGIVSANTSYAKSISKVTYDPKKIKPQQIVESIKATGYEVEK